MLVYVAHPAKVGRWDKSQT